MIIPYIQQVRELKQLPDQPALAIFDAFTGHAGEEIDEMLEKHHILAVKVHVHASCTDELQPMVNKSCKSHLRQKVQYVVR